MSFPPHRQPARPDHCPHLADAEFRLRGTSDSPKVTQPGGGRYQWEPRPVCLWIPRSLLSPFIILNPVHSKATIRGPCALFSSSQ